MSVDAAALLSYREFLKQDRINPFYQREVPLESYRSLTLPTRRWGEPAYAAFAAPAVRAPRKPLQVARPDRWWASRAAGGRLLVYARTAVLPLSDAPLPERVIVEAPPTLTSADEARAAIDALETLMDAAAAVFFAGDPGTANLRTGLLAALDGAIPDVLRPHHVALAPDFFAWLQR